MGRELFDYIRIFKINRLTVADAFPGQDEPVSVPAPRLILKRGHIHGRSQASAFQRKPLKRGLVSGNGFYPLSDQGSLFPKLHSAARGQKTDKTGHKKYTCTFHIYFPG